MSDLNTGKRKYAIAIHGGAGPLPYFGMNKKREDEYHKALAEALDTGYRILTQGGTALDAVEQVLVVIEDEPLFNAGVGSAINRDGEVEMDASIMCGKTMKAGAVGCIRNYANPIKIARALAEKDEHLFLSGEGAEEFAAEIGMQRVSNDSFKTEERMAWWKYKRDRKQEFTTDSGTAGAVALDMNGDLAAATSTGGLMMKRKGRMGDTAVIGAGTYANNETCAVSCSGTGENIIRAVAAHEISSLIRYKGLHLYDACDRLMQEKLTPFGGQAGLVAMDANGNIRFVFNADRMYRAWRVAGKEPMTRIYPGD